MFESRDYWINTKSLGLVRLSVRKRTGDGFYCAAHKGKDGTYAALHHHLVPWHCDPAVVQRGLDSYAKRRGLEVAK